MHFDKAGKPSVLGCHGNGRCLDCG